MSEYQYYEFRTVDRPLTEKEMEELGALSTRAEITPTSFTNVYNYGNFRGSPEKLMDQYFDAFVYVANWGTRRLMFRIPRRFLEVDLAAKYCDDEILTLNARQDHVVLEFVSEDEEGEEFDEGQQWMPSLISIRGDLMRGDHRALYLAWLAGIESHGEDEQEELPVPPGLAKLSGPLRSLADFLRITDELIEVAAEGNSGEAPAEPSRDELARWVKTLSSGEKDDVLLRFLTEEGDILLRTELLRRFGEATRPQGRETSQDRRRTVAQLLEARDARIQENQRREAERRAQKKAEEEKKAAEQRAKYLDVLARREPEIWKTVEEDIARKTASGYDQAVKNLLDLRDIARRSKTEPAFQSRIQELRERHKTKPSLLQRLDKKNL